MPHASDSAEQRATEADVLRALEAMLAVTFTDADPRLRGLKVDAFASGPPCSSRCSLTSDRRSVNGHQELTHPGYVSAPTDTPWLQEQATTESGRCRISWEGALSFLFHLRMSNNGRKHTNSVPLGAYAGCCRLV